MKKEEMYALGIDESRRKEFMDIYWQDVRKAADRMIKKKEGKEETPSPADVRKAIESIVKLIPDVVRLQCILAVANRHYHYMGVDQADKLRNAAWEAGDNSPEASTAAPLPEQTDQEPEQDNGGAEDVNTD